MTHGADGVDTSFVNRRRCTGAVGVIEVAVPRRVAVRPNRFAAGGVQAKNPFMTVRRRRLLLVWFRQLFVVHRVDAAAGDDDSGVTTADGLFPNPLEAAIRPNFRELGTVPGAVDARSAPARPVFGEGGRGQCRG